MYLSYSLFTLMYWGESRERYFLKGFQFFNDIAKLQKVHKNCRISPILLLGVVTSCIVDVMLCIMGLSSVWTWTLPGCWPHKAPASTRGTPTPPSPLLCLLTRSLSGGFCSISLCFRFNFLIYLELRYKNQFEGHWPRIFYQG